MPTPNYTIDKLKQHFTVTINELLPTQSGNSGKFLTTNGETISWATVDALPSQTGQSGKFLTTNGTTATWETVDVLPTQTNNSGKYLTTNGSVLSWATVDALPSQTGQNGKFLATNGTNAVWTEIFSGEVRVSSTHHPTSNSTTIVLTSSQVPESNVEQWGLSVYRDGIYLIDGIDYTYANNSRTLTFTRSFESNEVVSVNFAYLSSDSGTSGSTSLPTQTGQNGKFLSTNGLDAVWSDLPIASSSTLGTIKVGSNLSINSTTGVLSADDQLPSQTNNSGKYLTTNGTSVSWGTVDALPSQTGNSGKVLSTNGTTASWITDAFSSWDKDYDDLTNKPTIPVVPTTVSSFTNDAGYITSVAWNDVTNKPTLFSGSYNDLTNKPDLTLKANVADLASVATSGSYNDLVDTPTIPTVPTNISSFTNDAGYITTVAWNDVTNKPTFATVATSGDYDDLLNKPTIPTIPTNVSSFTNDSGYITSVDWDDVDNKPTFFSGNYNDLSNKPDLTLKANVSDLATVATSGSYNDLSDTPTIPTVPTNVSAFTNDSGYITGVAWNDISNKPTFATVANSGDYSDLINVPTNVSDFTNDAGYITSVDWDDVENKPSTFAPAIHNHDSEYTPLSTSVGSSTQGVYTDIDGVIRAMTYQLNKTVPADAVFTDTIYTLPEATTSELGGVIVGAGLSVTANGTLSADSQLPTLTGNSGKYLTTNGTNVSWASISEYSLTKASTTELGGIKVGDRLSIDSNGFLSADEQLPTITGNSGKFLTTDGTSVSWGDTPEYTLPTASSSTLGGIKVGSGLSISSGVLSADNQLPTQTNNSGKYLTTNGTSASWANITVTGVTTTGSGNAVTSITDNGAGQLTATKGLTFATLASPEFTGTPTAPTATAGDNSTQIATTAYVDGAVSSLVNSAPTTLDTLNELAAALGNDPNFATTVSTSLGNKLDSNSANYIKSLSISGKTITYTKGNNTTGTLTTQDTTYTQGTGITISNGVISANDQLPSQSNKAGKYLYTDGSDVSWEDIPEYTLPEATTSNLGGVIIGDGLSVAADGTISVDDQLPVQTSNNGKYLTTNGTSASWASIPEYSTVTTSAAGLMSPEDKTKLDSLDNYTLPIASSSTLGGIKVGDNLTIDSSTGVLSADNTLPSQTNNAGKFLTTDGTDASWSDILDEIKVSSIHYPTTNTTTIVLTEQQAIPSTINKYAMTVYRDGIYLNPSVDYGYNSTTRTLTFTEAFDEDEVVTVVFTYVTTDSQVTLDLDVDEYEAGSGITFTNNAVTNKVVINADDQLPSQANNSGKFLTTNGSAVSWETVDALPDQTNNSGKYLTTNGASASWATITQYTLPEATTSTLGGVIVGSGLSVNNGTISVNDQLPSQTSNSGKFLTTNGTTASWATVDALPPQSGNSGKFLTTNGTSASWEDIPNTELKISSLHYPSLGDTTVTLTSAESIPSDVNKYAMAVYRDGIYLNPSLDYGFNSSTRVITFSRAFEADEVVTVIFTYISSDTQAAIELDVEEYEAGTGIAFTTNAITNKVTISTIGDGLPSQSNNSGKFLTTNGSEASWADIDALPDQTNNSGKILVTDGTDADWKGIFSKFVNIAAVNGAHTVTIPSGFLDGEDYDSLAVYLAGVKQNSTYDYTINTSTGVVTFVDELLDGDIVTVGIFASTGFYDSSDNDVQVLYNQTPGVLTSDGSNMSWKNFTKMSYVVDTTSANEVITIPAANRTDVVSTEVYRNGLLLVPSDDYTINTTTGNITFVVPIQANEKINVITQKSIVGQVINYSTAVTQDVSDNSTNVATTAYVSNKIASYQYQTESDVNTAINNRFANPVEKVNVIASNASISINPNNGSLFMLSLSTNSTISIGTIQNGPYTTNGATITLYLNNTSNTISWGSSITWISGSAPDVTTNPSIITFITFNGGTNWYGSSAEVES